MCSCMKEACWRNITFSCQRSIKTPNQFAPYREESLCAPLGKGSRDQHTLPCIIHLPGFLWLHPSPDSNHLSLDSHSWLPAGHFDSIPSFCPSAATVSCSGCLLFSFGLLGVVSRTSLPKTLFKAAPWLITVFELLPSPAGSSQLLSSCLSASQPLLLPSASLNSPKPASLRKAFWCPATDLGLPVFKDLLPSIGWEHPVFS